MVVRAPAFQEGLSWLNSDPLVLSELKGKYVLLDFFTFGCINCLNNLHTIKKLYERFRDELIVIGVHTGKFSHEKELESLQDALLRYEITYPVINDPEHMVADAYAARGWPTTILVDNRGYIAHHASGEQKLLEWTGRLSSCGLSAKYKQQVDPEKSQTLLFPQKVFAAPNFLCIANTNANEIWLSDYNGQIIEVISADKPMGMAYRDNILYICESDSISRYNVTTKSKQVLIKNLRNPYDIVIREDKIIVALAGSHLINVYNIEMKTLIESYGNKFEALRDGKADKCQLAQPSGLTQLDVILYFVDAESSSLRMIQDGIVSTLIGEGLYTYGDSNSGEILLQHPQGLCAGVIGDGCGGGRLFIADTFNNKVKAYYPEDNSMITLLEDLNEPSGISKKGCELYIANTNEHEIIVFDLSKMESRVMEFRFNDEKKKELESTNYTN
jgi:thiol-disulfide isomerase/thioredoxin